MKLRIPKIYQEQSIYDALFCVEENKYMEELGP